jgi:periplasmic protein TonB
VRRWYSLPIFSLPLTASIALHGCVLVLMILLVERLPPVPLPEPKAGIEIMLAPPEPVVEAPAPAPEPPAIPEAEPPPPEPPPVVEAAPPPRPVTPEPAKLPPPRPKPVVRRPPQPVHMPPPEPARVPPPAPVQTAAIPRPAPPPPPTPPMPPAPTGPIVSAGYRAALSGWLESHKRYPDSARARGEEGRAVLRFRVARSGHVLSYAVVQGTGYPDLDAAIDQMMRGANLPPFPGDMTATDVEVSVTVRFALAR